MNKEIHLYFDDTGTRRYDIDEIKRDDGMDCFGLGGILVNLEDLDSVYNAHKVFCTRWHIKYPLHSNCIRGSRNNFAWVRNSEMKTEFFSSLEEFLLSLPVRGIATIIHRPGYRDRYYEKYQDRIWSLDKTAFVILVERSAKYAIQHGRKLRIFFEGTGKAEDRKILSYMQDLMTDGMPFDIERSQSYCGLTSSDFQNTVLGAPKRGSKSSVLLQIADLYLYPIAKGGYDKTYQPYIDLMNSERLIDSEQPKTERETLGIKYSCFD